MKPTLQEKYEFLCKHLKIEALDLWESDALLVAKKIYFQFPTNVVPSSVDEAVEFAMRSE